MAKRTKSRSRVRRERDKPPFPDHYNAIKSSELGSEHPVDVLINQIPGVAPRRRKLLKATNVWQSRSGDKKAFIAHEDARLEFSILRERLNFNAGFEHGLLAGRGQLAQLRMNVPCLEINQRSAGFRTR